MRKRGSEGIVRRRWQPGSAPFIYLTPSSSARTSVSGALTHSMPETIALFQVQSFNRSGKRHGPCRCCSSLYRSFPASELSVSSACCSFASRDLSPVSSRRVRVLRSSVSFRLMTFIDRISTNFAKSRAPLILRCPLNKKLL